MWVQRDREGVGDRNNASWYVVYLNYSNYRTDGNLGVKINIALEGIVAIDRTIVLQYKYILWSLQNFMYDFLLVAELFWR